MREQIETNDKYGVARYVYTTKGNIPNKLNEIVSCTHDRLWLAAGSSCHGQQRSISYILPLLQTSYRHYVSTMPIHRLLYHSIINEMQSIHTNPCQLCLLVTKMQSCSFIRWCGGESSPKF